jgi:acetyl-CoA carboxylase carboxyl transferase subunit alpha
VQAKGKAGDPPDVPKPRDQRQGGREWLQSILSRFGPVKEKASNTTVLDFEKPLVELDNRIKEVRGRQGASESPTTCGCRWSHAGAARFNPCGCVGVVLQVRQVAEENGVDVSNQIKELEERAKQVRSCCVLVAPPGSDGVQRVW